MSEAALPNVNMILLRHGNHAAVSGYDRIGSYIPSRAIPRVVDLNLAQRALCRLLHRFHSGDGSKWYGREGLLTEFVAARQWLKRSGQIFHFVYGENSYRHLGRLKLLRRNFVVCTYHTPPERFHEVVRDKAHLRHVDAVILVSRVAEDIFVELVGRDRVHFIPHGVDTAYFTPPAIPRAEHQGFRCLFVGSHLRDFELLANTARQFARVDADVHFEIITLKKDYHHFDGLTNVTLRRGISDDELRQAYQQADVLLMPLKDATANNSLLEAMACGLPIIATDLPGVRDYVDETCARLVQPKNCSALGNALVELRRDPAERARLGAAARARAEQYSFERVASLTEDVYRKLAGSAYRAQTA